MNLSYKLRSEALAKAKWECDTWKGYLFYEDKESKKFVVFNSRTDKTEDRFYYERSDI